jgi:hypothetical protein
MHGDVGQKIRKIEKRVKSRQCETTPKKNFCCIDKSSLQITQSTYWFSSHENFVDLMCTFVNIVITFVLLTNYREYFTNSFVNLPNKIHKMNSYIICEMYKSFFECRYIWSPMTLQCFGCVCIDGLYECWMLQS